MVAEAVVYHSAVQLPDSSSTGYTPEGVARLFEEFDLMPSERGLIYRRCIEGDVPEACAIGAIAAHNGFIDLHNTGTEAFWDVEGDDIEEKLKDRYGDDIMDAVAHGFDSMMVDAEVVCSVLRGDYRSNYDKECLEAYLFGVSVALLVGADPDRSRRVWGSSK